VRIFPDSKVWISAFATRGLCYELIRSLLRRHGRGDIEVLLGQPVREEILRILVEKFHATEGDLAPVRTALDIAESVPAAPEKLLPAVPDLDDVPVIASALAGRAEIFITGDQALLDLSSIEGLHIVSPRQFWQTLTGLR
jgi:predicted nucleic acid-binding protein